MRWVIALLTLVTFSTSAEEVLSPQDRALLGVIEVNRHAKRACSGVFLSGRTAEDVLRQDHVVEATDYDVVVNRVAGWVRLSSETTTATAVYRPGLGCTLLYRLTVEELLRQPTGNLAPRVLDSDLPWPRGSKVEVKSPEGLDQTALTRVLDWAFAEPDPENRQGSRAAIVIYDGQIVGERYAPGFAHDRPLIIWSMTKSLTNALVGMLVNDGVVDHRAPASVPEWRRADDPRAAITLDQLLRMSSGLKFDEIYTGGLIDVTISLFGDPSSAHYAAKQPLAREPDAEWAYSSGTTNIVSRLVRHSLGGELNDYVTFARARLFNPLGMGNTVIELDEAGTFVGSSFGYSTPRDLARFGLLLLQDGVWEGKRLLPVGWVRYSTTPTPKAPRGVYGAHFWLNAGDPGDPTRRAMPNVPTDGYWMSGYEGQTVMMVPSRQTVIVRLGRTPPGNQFNIDRFVSEILAAVPPM
jgi:CubicO group peptidase (beta-lactamase class C family)|tara:strand:+ start:1135 stop:2535 length:1401 start_codon:yes stop_codon:yes gene_type:complete